MNVRSEDFSIFFKIVDDPQVFNFRDINLSKFFYDKWIVKYRRMPKKAQKGFLPEVGKQRFIFIRIGSFLSTYLNLFRLILSRPKQSRILFFGSSSRRTQIEGDTYDTYNARIISDRGRDNFIILEDFETGVSKTFTADWFLQDFQFLFGMLFLFVIIIRGIEINHFSSQLCCRYPALQLKRGDVFRMVSYFYAQYLGFRVLLSLAHVSQLIMLVHYGRLPAIAACKKINIRVVELMHGAIIKHHPHYNIPNMLDAFKQPFRQFLLPDSLGVYGEYWKNIVIAGNQFDPSTIFIAGYYLKLPPINIHEDKGDKVTILIATQTTVQNDILNYVHFLKTHLDREKWRVVIKPHPLENYSPFLDLLEPGFIELSLENIYSQLEKAHIHISVRSTVLYEAIQYRVCNYVLLADSILDECMEIVETGVARALKPDELPTLYEVEEKTSQYYFADYDPKSIFDRLENHG